MTKTTYRKNPQLAFEDTSGEVEASKTYKVSMGDQHLGYVTYRQVKGYIYVSDMKIQEEYFRFGVEHQILDALFSSEDVHTITVMAPLSATSFYGTAGFECDSKHVLLTKTK
tara:strand:+ start:252 stop:587 length:336 start_codon:yes stop_codon:yes gene_type:complete